MGRGAAARLFDCDRAGLHSRRPPHVGPVRARYGSGPAGAARMQRDGRRVVNHACKVCRWRRPHPDEISDRELVTVITDDDRTPDPAPSAGAATAELTLASGSRSLPAELRQNLRSYTAAPAPSCRWMSAAGAPAHSPGATFGHGPSCPSGLNPGLAAGTRPEPWLVDGKACCCRPRAGPAGEGRCARSSSRADGEV